LDPTNWPPGTGTVLFLIWLAYAVAASNWVHPLLWTALPVGLALFLFAERYPWRVVLIVVVPLALLTAYSQVVATWLEAPTWVALGIYVVACGYFSVVICLPNRDRLIARLPTSLLGERFATRLAWVRFEESVVAANAVVRQLSATDGQTDRRLAIARLATEARREARRGGTWAVAWAAHAAWMEGLDDLVGVEPTTAQIRRVNDLLAESNDAQMLAIERTGAFVPE
jgi:hypothetical protein